MTPSSPISITGIGWTTPLGDDLEAVWQRLLAGETGLVEIPHTARLLNGLGAPVAPSLLGPPLPADAPADQRMTAMALPALYRALAAAGRDLSEPGVQLVLGTSLGAFLEGEPASTPLHAWADAIGAAAGAARPPISLSTACSSGSDAILVGAELIRAGAATCCVCGGVDVLTLTKRLAHSALGSMSRTMLRAFDLRHDGTLLGEGAGFVVLEAIDAAELAEDARRTARAPIALLRGVGSANDAAGMTTPDVDALGARFALLRSLADAGLDAGAIDIINAHGSGTPLNDATEARAFRDVFGGAAVRPIVFGTKGNFGHSLGATGVLEAITVLLALRHGQVPPIVALEQPYAEMEFTMPLGRPLLCDARFGLSVTLGFGGFDTSLIFERVG